MSRVGEPFIKSVIQVARIRGYRYAIHGNGFTQVWYPVKASDDDRDILVWNKLDHRLFPKCFDMTMERAAEAMIRLLRRHHHTLHSNPHMEQYRPDEVGTCSTPQTRRARRAAA